MSVAVESKNMQPVKVAQIVLKAGNEKLQETSQNLTQLVRRKKLSENDSVAPIMQTYPRHKEEDLNCIFVCIAY